MNNTIIRNVSVTGTYAPVTSQRTVATVTVTSAISNGSAVYLKGDTGDDVAIWPGEWHIFKSINLAELKVKGTSGDVVTVIGGTW